MKSRQEQKQLGWVPFKAQPATGKEDCELVKKIVKALESLNNKFRKFDEVTIFIRRNYAYAGLPVLALLALL